MSTNLFQKAINDSHSFHRLIKKNDLGGTKYDAWTGLSKAILSNAYAVWSDNHDNAGRAVKVVDEATAKLHRDALFASLRAMVDTVGEVAFSDGNAATLTVDADMSNSITTICTQHGWKYVDAVAELDIQILEAKEEVKAAKDNFNRYNYNGVSEAAKQYAQDKLDAAEKKLEDLRTERKTEVDKKDAKTPARVPADEKKFRQALENLIWDMMNQQKAMSYEDYREMRKAHNKAKRDRKKAAKEAAEKKYTNA